MIVGENMITLTISIIIPSYNEEKNLAHIVGKIEKEMKQIHYQYEIIMIDDGSTDQTLAILQELSIVYPQLKYLSFTRNFGKEAAVLAGLQYAKGNAAIIMDADLQHPPAMMHQLIRGFEEGYDQVIAKRNRKGDSWIRSRIATLYYRVVNKAVDVRLSDGEGDFRLLSRKAVNGLLTLSEGNRFSKGLYAWIGLEQKVISYDNEPRMNGDSKWSFSKLLSYGIDGTVSFNNKPLRICLYTGFLILLFSLIYIFVSFFQVVKNGVLVPGYFTTVSAVLFLGGIQLVCLGIIGEYIGRIYYETKKRPHYLIKQTNLEEEEKHAVYES